jgi:hypothetical protein
VKPPVGLLGQVRDVVLAVSLSKAAVVAVAAGAGATVSGTVTTRRGTVTGGSFLTVQGVPAEKASLVQRDHPQKLPTKRPRAY